jgi:hypothetical protein
MSIFKKMLLCFISLKISLSVECSLLWFISLFVPWNNRDEKIYYPCLECEDLVEGANFIVADGSK